MFVRQLVDASNLSRDPLQELQWTHRFITVWVGLVAFRLLLLMLSPLELSGDEAYYWEWGRRLDWGYFSKPPLIGWLMALFGWIGGDSTWGIRLGALVFSSAALIPLFALGRAMFSAEAGFWAAIALALTPGNAAASFFFTIDAPLVFAWSLSLWATWRLFEGASSGWLTGLCLAVGLGLGILSKQMMLVFPALVLVYLVLEPRHRPWLGRRGWWLPVLAGLACLLPPLLWNWQNDWITVSHTTGTNFQSPPVSLEKHVSRFGEFVGAQLGLIGPVLYLLLLWLLTRTARCWGKLQPAERFLWLFCAPGLLVFFGVALKIRALANWPAVYYPAGFVLLGGWVASLLSCSRIRSWGRGLFRFGVALGLVLTLTVHVAMFLLPRSGLEFEGKAPLRRLMGWSDFARQVAAVEAEIFGGTPHALIVAGHRYNASELAFYHPDQPTVFVWNETGHPQSQYDLWPGPESATAEAALIIVPHDKDGAPALPESLLAVYSELEPVRDLDIALGPTDRRHYSLWRGQRTTGHTE